MTGTDSPDCRASREAPIRHTVDVFITVDTEVWPVHAGGWPQRPLSSSDTCEREFAAYMLGGARSGSSGLPYQLDVLSRCGLNATFFVDPMFSFALGLDKLTEVINLIQAGGQEVELHLHPEWLTDPRCRGLGEFHGPLLSAYSESEQASLIELGLERLRDGGARTISAFRAGSWGCDRATLGVLSRAGITIDSSLNAAFSHSFPSLAQREAIHEPVVLDDVIEVPVTRFADGLSERGRPLSLVGVSTTEMRRVLDRCHAAKRKAVVIVLHSNEFTRTELLWKGREIQPRRLVAKRFEWLCGYLATESARFRTRHISELTGLSGRAAANGGLPASTILLTARRIMEQFLSRWY